MSPKQSFLVALIVGALAACGSDSAAPHLDDGGDNSGGDGGIVTLCGNGELDDTEVCDDGNTRESDYCSRDCGAITGRCGDGVRQSNERCDDPPEGGFAQPNPERGYCNETCTGLIGACGDGSIQGPEQCDPGSADALGCGGCVIATGSHCEGEPSVCGPHPAYWSVPLNEFTQQDAEAYCTWLTSASFGDAWSLSCPGGITLTRRTVAECADRLLPFASTCVAPLRQLLECSADASICAIETAGPVSDASAACQQEACTRVCESNTWSCSGNTARLCSQWGNGYVQEVVCGLDECAEGNPSTANGCDADQCAAGTDDCDTNATCTDTTTGFTCACNTGYEGDGTACLRIPALDAVTLSIGELRPVFDGSTLQYVVDVPMLGADSTTVTASTPDAVEIRVMGSLLTSGSTSSAIYIGGGSTPIDIVLTADGYKTVTYMIEVRRGLAIKLKPNGNAVDDAAGSAVAVSGDIVVVGNPYASNLFGGSVSLFERVSGAWTLTAGFLGDGVESNRRFGASVAIDGDLGVIGAPDTYGGGEVYWFTRTNGAWDSSWLNTSVPDTDDRFGSSVAISGDTIVVGAPGEDSSATGINGSQTSNSATDAGAAYVFVRSGNSWTQQAYLKASNTGAGDAFGTSVSISDDTVVVGAPGEDSALSGIDPDGTNNAALGSGAAYVFVRTGTVWTQQAYIKPSGVASTGGGSSVDVDGNVVVIGSPSLMTTGAVHVFSRAGTAWNQTATLLPMGVTQAISFGRAVAVRAGVAVVGAPLSGNQTLVNRGGAYHFFDSGAGWSQGRYFSEGRGNAGAAVDLDTWIAMGVPGDDSTFIGPPSDSMYGGTDSGAVFVY